MNIVNQHTEMRDHLQSRHGDVTHFIKDWTTVAFGGLGSQITAALGAPDIHIFFDAIPADYIGLFLDAIDILEIEVDTAMNFFNGLGYPPFGNTLLPSEILNVKNDVFDTLFGNATERREAWGHLESASVANDRRGLNTVDIGQEIAGNANNIAGFENGQLHLRGEFDQTAEKYKFEVTRHFALPLVIS